MAQDLHVVQVVVFLWRCGCTLGPQLGLRLRLSEQPTHSAGFRVSLLLSGSFTAEHRRPRRNHDRGVAQLLEVQLDFTSMRVCAELHDAAASALGSLRITHPFS